MPPRESAQSLARVARLVPHPAEVHHIRANMWRERQDVDVTRPKPDQFGQDRVRAGILQSWAPLRPASVEVGSILARFAKNAPDSAMCGRFCRR